LIGEKGGISEVVNRIGVVALADMVIIFDDMEKKGKQLYMRVYKHTARRENGTTSDQTLLSQTPLGSRQFLPPNRADSGRNV